MQGNRAIQKLCGYYALVISLFLTGVLVGNRAATVFSEHKPIQREHCFILDAGHGGEDGGTTSCTGKLESSFNLEIAKRLNDLFHLLGYDTVMTRTEDTSIYIKGGSIAQKKMSDLKERVRIVNETEGGILVSIHQNHFSDERYSGPQVFYANSRESERLAKLLQSRLITVLSPGNSRREKQSKGVYLMEQIQRTGVLIECGFLSNTQEEAKLRMPEYQKLLSCVIASAIAEYLDDT